MGTGNNFIHASRLCNMTDLSAGEQEDNLKDGTIANPESRADVRLEAFSLARLRYSFLQDRACSECSFRLMFSPKKWTSSADVVTLLLLRHTTQTGLQHPNSVRNIQPRRLTVLRKLFSFIARLRRVVLLAPYITHKSARPGGNIR